MLLASINLILLIDSFMIKHPDSFLSIRIHKYRCVGTRSSWYIHQSNLDIKSKVCSAFFWFPLLVCIVICMYIYPFFKSICLRNLGLIWFEKQLTNTFQLDILGIKMTTKMSRWYITPTPFITRISLTKSPITRWLKKCREVMESV